MIPVIELGQYMLKNPGVCFSSDFFTNKSGAFDNIDSLDEYFNTVYHYLDKGGEWVDEKNVHPIFKEADWQMAVKQKNISRPAVRTVYVDAPMVKGMVENGPLVATEDWYISEHNKYYRKYCKWRKMSYEDMFEVLARKDELRWKIGQLDRKHDKKWKKKLIKWNEELKDIDAMMEWYSIECGVAFDSLDRGTAFSRFIKQMKDKLKKAFRNICKWFKRNRGPICNILFGWIPRIFGAVKLIKMIFAKSS